VCRPASSVYRPALQPTRSGQLAALKEQAPDLTRSCRKTAGDKTVIDGEDDEDRALGL
jgi:hypothetical protein